jgi:hypothetical protein
LLHQSHEQHLYHLLGRDGIVCYRDTKSACAKQGLVSFACELPAEFEHAKELGCEPLSGSTNDVCCPKAVQVKGNLLACHSQSTCTDKDLPVGAECLTDDVRSFARKLGCVAKAPSNEKFCCPNNVEITN